MVAHRASSAISRDGFKFASLVSVAIGSSALWLETSVVDSYGKQVTYVELLNQEGVGWNQERGMMESRGGD